MSKTFLANTTVMTTLRFSTLHLRKRNGCESSAVMLSYITVVVEDP